MSLIPLPKKPIHKTALDWSKTYYEFNQIFEGAYLDPFLPILEHMTISSHDEPEDKMFLYFLAKQYNRIILPPMDTTDNGNLYIISNLKGIISMRSYALKYKYDMMAATMPDNINDFYYNYNITRQYTQGTTYTQGSVSHSGSDSTRSRVNRTTKEFTFTGESTGPKEKNRIETKTQPENPGASDNSNSVITTYGHQINTTPGSETKTFNQTATGYYNSGTKAKMLEEIRSLLNFNLMDSWLKDMMPAFCTDYYVKPSSKSPFGIL